MAEIELKISDLPVPYNEAVTEMEARVQSIHEGRAGELIWLLQHPSLYTAGTSAKVEDLVEPDRLPVFNTGRGGQFTYHGPGQRIVYVIFDLKTRGANIRQFVQNLENWVIGTLGVFNVKGEIRDDRVGVWVDRGRGREDKIAAIGIRVRRWISYHGISINIDPDLSHYAGIVPCGIADHGVTSLDDLGLTVTMAEFDHELLAQFSKIFGGPSLDRSPTLESLPR
jgi:lipoyl(octanoyl) transferase